MGHVGPSEIAGPETEAIASELEAIGVKQRQWRVFLVEPIFAALAGRAAAPDAFPAAAGTFTKARYWPIRIVPLCVAVAGWCRTFRVDDTVSSI